MRRSHDRISNGYLIPIIKKLAIYAMACSRKVWKPRLLIY